MENKFKVGDKVRLISKNYYCDNGFDIGDTVEVNDSDCIGTYKIRIENDSTIGYVNADQLVKIDFTKADLQTGDVVTTRKGTRLLLIDEHFKWLDGEACTLDYLFELNDDLTYNYDLYVGNENNDIIKVERPTYTTVYERDENEVKEMTIAEISKALGYEVKIVKEDK